MKGFGKVEGHFKTATHFFNGFGILIFFVLGRKKARYEKGYYVNGVFHFVGVRLIFYKNSIFI
jgi:hypothetical protein